MTTTRTWDREPSALRYMLGAFRPSPGWRSDRGCPDLRLHWRGYRIDAAVRTSLAAEAGAIGRDPATLDVLVPQVTGFRLVMAMLTDPRWPLPIWNALQVRNRLRLLRPLCVDEPGDLTLGHCGWRVLEKGLEIDLHLALVQQGAPVWDGVTTFYYRGRHGAPHSSGDARGAPAVSPAPPDDESTPGVREQRWTVPSGDRRRLGRVTGDYNGLHLWDAYARRMGFPAAFAHPQRIVAQCLAQCLAHADAPPETPAVLDLWIKGPVFYDRPVTLRSVTDRAAERTTFGLRLDGDPRPALVGVLSAG